MKKAFLVLLALALLAFQACEVVQTSTPSPVEITITQPPPTPTDTSETPPPGATGTITLEPANVQVKVGGNVNVKVIVRDDNGVEVPSQNVSVNIIDKTVLSLVEIDNRIIAFQGVSTGVTSVIISASGLQTSLVATVT